MKVIIDMPDYGSVDNILKACENAQPLSTELEKIKAEIEEEKLDVDLDIGNETIYNNAINDVLEILDKHIKENKE